MSEAKKPDILHGGGRAGQAGEKQSRDPEESVNLLEELASFCQAAGEFPTALEYYAQILSIARQASDSTGFLSTTARQMASCYEGTGEFDKALEMLDIAGAQIDESTSPNDAAGIMIERAHVLARRGDYLDARGHADKALAILQERPMSSELGEAFGALGQIALRTGRMDEAQNHYESSLAVYRALGDRPGMGRCYNNLALVSKNVGHLEDAAGNQAKALGIARDLGKKLQVGIRLNNLGIIEFKRGDWEAAKEAWEESLRIFTELGNKWEISYGYLNLGHFFRATRQWDKAKELYKKSLESARENGDRRCEVLYHEYYGEVCHHRGELIRAESILSEGLALAGEVSPDSELSAEILRRRGELRLTAGDLEGAEDDLRLALDISRRVGDRFEEGATLRGLGRLEFALNRVDRAEKSLRESIFTLTEIGAHYERALSQVRLAECCHTTEAQRQEAMRMLTAAVDAFRSQNSTYDEARAQLAWAELLVEDGDSLAALEALDSVEGVIDATGSGRDLDRIRAIRIRTDRSLVSSSVSDSNSLATFNVLLKRIQSIGDVQERLDRTLDFLVERTQTERLMLLQWEEQANRLRVRESRGVPAQEWHTTVEVARMAVERAIDNGWRPIYSTNPLRDSRIDTGLPQLERIGSLLVIPVRGDENCWGGLYLERNVGAPPFGQVELDFAVALSGVASGLLLDLRAERIRHENLRLKHRLGIGEGFEQIVTQSPRLLKIIDTLQKLRDSDANVLLQGETGTGKGLFSQAVHASSLRNGKPFVTINCADLSEDILESELFGHDRGAFTDAKNSKQGLFVRANGGTVFIDEVDKASRKFQDTLLRVVDSKEVKPVGSTEAIPVDVRIICAANKDLREEVENDRFLKDLYFRLRVVSIYLPPLRERREDISLLGEHFLQRHSDAQGRSFAGFDQEAVRLLVDYHWPGNVRDLAHEIERIVAITPDGSLITPEHLSPEITESANLRATGTLSEVVERIEQQMIRDALKKCEGNKSQAARVLGLSRRGLLNKLQRYRIR